MVIYPGDWEVKKLGDILKVKRGKRVVRRQLSTRGKFPVYQNSLAPLGFFEHYNCEAHSAFIIAAGNAGDVGFSEIPFWAADDCYYFDECRNIEQKFLYYMLLHHQRYIYTQTRRTSIPRLSHDILENILIPLPPLKEQIAIAETLAAFDTHITNLTELITKKKAIRDGALDELMTGRTRLGGFCGDWEDFTIDDITDNIITGGTPSTTHSEYWGGTIPWLSSTEVHQKHITKPTTYITDIGFNNSSAKIAPEGSVIIALAGQGKTRGTAALLESSMALNQSLAALVTNDKCNNKFLFYLIENMYLALRKLSSGDGGRGGLNKKLIRNIKVHIPPLDEQIAIADTLSALDKEISSLETERAKISSIRDGAINDLLTGKVRLKIGI